MRVVYVGWQRGLRETALRLGAFLLAHAEDHCMLDVLHVLELLVHGEQGNEAESVLAFDIWSA